MRILFIVLLLSGFSAVAAPNLTGSSAVPALAGGGCESQLDPNELELAGLLKLMHNLKKSIATPEVVSQLSALNDQALTIISRQLDRRGIKHVIVPRNPRFKALFRSVEEQKELEARLNVQQWQLDETGMSAAAATSEALANEFGQTYIRTMQEIDMIRRQLMVDKVPILSSHALAQFYAFGQAHIVILDDPSHPQMLRDAVRSFPETHFTLSPEMRSSVPSQVASVLESYLFLPIEQVFLDTFGNDVALAHEALHLEHDDALKRGIETPYNIRVTAEPGQRLHSARAGFYDRSFTFGELATWNQDMNAYVPSRPFKPARRYLDGKVYEQTSREAAEYEAAQGLVVLGTVAAQALDALSVSLNDHADEIQFSYANPVAAEVLIPWYGEDGKKLATIKIQVVGLNGESQERRWHMLLDYIVRASKVAFRHQANGFEVYGRYAQPPRNPWRPVN